jgi:hypothetical protein
MDVLNLPWHLALAAALQPYFHVEQTIEIRLEYFQGSANNRDKGLVANILINE